MVQTTSTFDCCVWHHSHNNNYDTECMYMYCNNGSHLYRDAFSTLSVAVTIAPQMHEAVMMGMSIYWTQMYSTYRYGPGCLCVYAWHAMHVTQITA